MHRAAGVGLLSLLSMTLAGCGGGGGDDQLPPGATIMLEPAEITWNIDPAGSPCFINPNLYQDRLFSIRVLNSAGSPIGETPITVTLDLSGNTFGGYPVLELYEDRNGNGVVDGPSERVSDSNDPLFRSSTARYTGERYLILRTNLSCPYRGSLNVYAFGVGSGMSVEVRERGDEEEEVTPDA